LITFIFLREALCHLLTCRRPTYSDELATVSLATVIIIVVNFYWQITFY